MSENITVPVCPFRPGRWASARSWSVSVPSLGGTWPPRSPARSPGTQVRYGVPRTLSPELALVTSADKGN